MSTLATKNHTHISKEEFDHLPKIAQDAIISSGIPLSVTHTIKTASVKVEAQQSVDGCQCFTIRYDWGDLNGDYILNLSWPGVTARSAVFVAIGEGAAGGPTAGKFIGASKFTLFNVAPFDGGVGIWVNVNWGDPIRLYVDYVVFPIDQFAPGN
jgi:hypothetical protein